MTSKGQNPAGLKCFHHRQPEREPINTCDFERLSFDLGMNELIASFPTEDKKRDVSGRWGFCPPVLATKQSSV